MIDWLIDWLYLSWEKEKGSCCLAFTSSTKRFIRPFHFVGMQRQKELYKKHYAHAKLLFCFIIIKPIASLPFSLLLLLSMLKPPIFFFPCSFQFGPKNNRTLILLLPLICFFFSFWVFDSVIVTHYAYAHQDCHASLHELVSIETIQQWYFPLRRLFHLYFISKKTMHEV